MNDLRQAAARERRAPLAWWSLMILGMGFVICVNVWPHSPEVAMLLAVLVTIGWLAPVVAFWSLSAPHRARKPVPPPGGGSYKEWMKQARLLGRVLLYFEDNLEISDSVQASVRAAREDLRDTLKSHPLRDDLERVCGRIRSGALQEVKNDFWQVNRHRIDGLIQAMNEEIAASTDPEEEPMIRHQNIEDVAAMMARHCMPRMLERERLICSVECSWLATTAICISCEAVSPIEIAARLVIEWSDFSEPWNPPRILRRVMEQGEESMPEEVPVAAVVPVREAVAGEAVSGLPVAGEASSGRRRVRVRVRRSRRYVHRRKRGPSIWDILLSFGQWIRYSFRAWMLYR